jgi:hypothetical protein
MTTDAQFDQVIAGSLLPNPCTPVPTDELDFRGLLLQAPTDVWFQPGQRDPLFGAFARMLVCGIYCFDANYLDLRERFLERIVLVAVDVVQHRAYSTRLRAIPNAIAVPSPLDGMPLSAADWAGRSVTGYFNPNLAEILPLPAEETSYVVYAALGTYLSNVVRIAVRRRRPS